MDSIRIRNQQSRKFLGHLDAFDQKNFIGNSMHSERQNVECRSQVDSECISDNVNGTALAKKNAVNIRTSDGSFGDRVIWERDNTFDAVVVRILIENLVTVSMIIAFKFELAVRSRNAPSWGVVVSVISNSERWKQTESLPFSERIWQKWYFPQIYFDDETRLFTPDETSEFRCQEHTLTSNHTRVTGPNLARRENCFYQSAASWNFCAHRIWCNCA